MPKEDWEKAWMGSYCIACNPDPNGRTMTAHPTCLTRGTCGLDANILMEVGLGDWVLRGDEEIEGAPAQEPLAARDEDFASERQDQRAEADEVGESSDEMSVCSSPSEREEEEDGRSETPVFANRVEPECEMDEESDDDKESESGVDEDSDDGEENEPAEELRKCRRCSSTHPISSFQKGVNSCNNCRQKEKDTRSRLKDQERCTRCRQPLESGFVGVRCLQCRGRHNTWAKSHPKNRTKKGQTGNGTTPA